MKKKVIVALLCALCLSFVGCDKDYVKHNSDETSTEKEESRDTTESEKKTETKKVDTEEKEDNSKVVIAKINSGTRLFNEGVEISSSVDEANSLEEMYDIYYEAYLKYYRAANQYNMAYELCGDDPNLLKLKLSLNTMVFYCPSSPKSSSKKDLEEFVLEEMNFNLLALDVEKEAEKVASQAGLTLSDIKTQN